MIDKKKIGMTAAKYAKETFNHQEEQFSYMNGFYAGADWAQKEFAKSLWHHVSEPPKNNTDIVFIDIYGDMYNERNFYTDSSLNIYRKDWTTFNELFHITRWCYLDDILPKEEEK